MQRDWDLIREILIRTEKKLPQGKMMHTEIDGHFLMQVGDHIAVLHDEGYIKAMVVRAHGYVLWATVSEITPKGFELLSILKNHSIWHRIKLQARIRRQELCFRFIEETGTAELYSAFCGVAS